MAPTNDSLVDCSNRSHRIRLMLYTINGSRVEQFQWKVSGKEEIKVI